MGGVGGERSLKKVIHLILMCMFLEIRRKNCFLFHIAHNQYHDMASHISIFILTIRLILKLCLLLILASHFKVASGTVLLSDTTLTLSNVRAEILNKKHNILANNCKFLKK